MLKIERLFLALCLILLGIGASKAQSRSALEDEAYEYLNNFEYAKAYNSFDVLHTRYPKEADYHFKLGICALGYPEKKERAIGIFLEIFNKTKSSESQLYLAKAYHVNYRFNEALDVLKPLQESLSKSKKKDDKQMLPDVQLVMNNCINGNILTSNKMGIESVKNIGPPINTKEIEGVPVITADESMMIFTYVGKKSMGGKLNAMLQPDRDGAYLSDIYMSLRESDSTWKEPVPITALNTKANDAAIALSPDGLTLFTFLSNNENEGDIFVSKHNGTEFSKPEPLNRNINSPDYWEGSCSISADGKYLYFASERPIGGLGGRDIWVSELVDGDWGPPVNMGPKINTPYDDDAPFIHPDGVTLFFSSKGHTSIGGYDIMFSIKEGNEWGEPKNMGIPVNTTEDDRYYVINSKGDIGYFSSDRATSDGKGGQDIYMVTPGIPGEKLIVAMIKGNIYGDNKPLEAKIEVTKMSDNEKLGPYSSNKLNGKYLLTFKPGHSYHIKVTAEGFDTAEDNIDLETLTGFAEKKKDYYLYTKAFAAANPTEIKKDTTRLLFKEPPAVIVVTTTKDPKKVEPIVVNPPKEEMAKVEAEVKKEEEPKKEIVASVPVKTEQGIKKKIEKPKEEAVVEPVTFPCDSKLPDLASVKGKSLNEGQVYKQLMDIAGNYCADNLVFKVQIGAYRKPENYTYSHLKTLGKVETAGYPDGITRFTQKQFTTLNEAEKHRQKAIAKGQTDSWIVAFYNGTRYTLEDFIMVDFQGKPVN